MRVLIISRNTNIYIYIHLIGTCYLDTTGPRYAHKLGSTVISTRNHKYPNMMVMDIRTITHYFVCLAERSLNASSYARKLIVLIGTARQSFRLSPR